MSKILHTSKASFTCGIKYERNFELELNSKCSAIGISSLEVAFEIDTEFPIFKRLDKSFS